MERSACGDGNAVDSIVTVDVIERGARSPKSVRP